LIQALLSLLLLAATGCSGLLYYPDKNNYLAPTTPVDIQRRRLEVNGAQLDLWQAKAKGARKPEHCVLLVHGNGQNASAHIQNILWMTDAGFEVYAFDYQGYGTSTGEPSPENTVKDTVVVLDQIAQRCAPRKLVLIGQSLGGAVALRALAQAAPPKNLDAVVLDSAFLSYRQMGVDVLSRFWLFWPFQWLGWIVLSDRWAPNGALDKLPDLPVLVLHGDKDTIVPYRFGQDLYEELPMRRKQWLAIEGGRHTEGFFLANGKHRAEILEWIRTQLSKK
jgi:alpha-beta hydrolase superfamily lysophospholipase